MQGDQYDQLINIAIRDNELSESEWALNPLVQELYWFVDFFNIAFFKDAKVPVPALTFEKTNIKSLGYYRIGFNDWAVRDQINLNKIYLHRPLFETLQTLVHEMVHSWEHTHLDKDERTTNWYHKTGFKNKMAQIGIETNDKGMHKKVGDPFIHLLRQHGVTFSGYTMEKGLIIIPIKKKPKGKSKLSKWSCGCTNVRVGVKSLEALCLKCNNMFEKIENDA